MKPTVHPSDPRSSFYGMLNPTSYRLSGYLLNPYPRHRIETMHQNRISVDPNINSPPHRDWQLLSPWLKQKQIIFLAWKWRGISQVQHLTIGNIILDKCTWNNSLQQVFFQERKIYNHLQADIYVQKFHIHLLRKTLVSKIDKKMIPCPWT